MLLNLLALNFCLGTGNFVPKSRIDWGKCKQHFNNYGNGKAFNIPYSQNVLTSVSLVRNTNVVGAFIIFPVWFKFLSNLRSDPVPIFSMFFIPWPPVKVFTIFFFDKFEVWIKDIEWKFFRKGTIINFWVVIPA